MTMKYLVYVSEAVTPPSNDELARLLDHSRRKNAATGVTGLLVYRFNADFRRGNYLQIIESSDATIEDLWRRISTDARHHSIIVLEEGHEAHRMFNDWTMGFRNVDESDLRRYPGWEDMGSDAFWARAERETLKDARAILLSFYERTPSV
jgi:hypothetical protein